jgi:hypothetical protein
MKGEGSRKSDGVGVGEEQKENYILSMPVLA